MAIKLPLWGQLLVGLAALMVTVMLGSYVALGKEAFRDKAAASLASAVLGFILTPIFVGISGIAGLPDVSSAVLTVMWVMLFRGLQKLEWPASMGLSLACVVLTYALKSWCGFGAILVPWWQMAL